MSSKIAQRNVMARFNPNDGNMAATGYDCSTNDDLN
jgi:hypothetical protein